MPFPSAKKLVLISGVSLLALVLIVYNVLPAIRGGELEKVPQSSSGDKKPVVYYFWFPCVECESTNNAVAEAVKAYGREVDFRLIDVTKNPDARRLAERFGVRYVPYLVFLDEKGEVLLKKGGETSFEELSRMLRDLYGVV